MKIARGWKDWETLFYSCRTSTRRIQDQWNIQNQVIKLLKRMMLTRTPGTVLFVDTCRSWCFKELSDLLSDSSILVLFILMINLFICSADTLYFTFIRCFFLLFIVTTVGSNVTLLFGIGLLYGTSKFVWTIFSHFNKVARQQIK